MKKTLLIATALTTSAYTFSSVAAQPSSSVLQSLPAEVQKEIEDVRARCREHLSADASPSSSPSYGAWKPHDWGPTPEIPGVTPPTTAPSETTPSTPPGAVPGPQTSTAPASGPTVSSGDEGLILFTVSGMQAVMVSDLELCDGQCHTGANCSNRGSYGIAIYVRSINGTWRKALSTDARRSVFLSTDNNKFKALVLSVAGGNKDCPTRDAMYREGKETYVFPAWKQSCDAVVRWNGTKFTYKPL
jgi:hypothetical protein